MATKKFALHNSYFKVSRMNGLPDTMIEIAEYLKEHGELPFRYDGNNWVYDAFVERQKYRGVANSQYLTPDATADRMMHFAGKYFTENNVLEPCCGTGQITKELLKDGYNVITFDNDKDLCEVAIKTLDLFGKSNCTVLSLDFKNYEQEDTHRNQIIANPPYEIAELTNFLEWIAEIQNCGGISILLMPKGFINKDKPKRTFNVLRKFGVLEVEDMQEEFARTKTRAEIVVLKKL
ncbi:MAG: methyltransferase domain-containing protein [Prevotellaceae bacterium]|nr:methyltransferase domain-containing protein [Prevotellaceae bacterium]